MEYPDTTITLSWLEFCWLRGNLSHSLREIAEKAAATTGEEKAFYLDRLNQLTDFDAKLDKHDPRNAPDELDADIES